MAEQKKNFFQRMGKKFSDVIGELKRVTWPSKDKLSKTSAVVLLVILFFAVYLTIIGTGGRWVLDKIGFYKSEETTATTPSTSYSQLDLGIVAESEVEASESSES